MSSEGRQTGQNFSRADRDDSDSINVASAKRTKRAQYAARACAPCQTRKIRCEGGTPCAQCTSRGRQCVERRPQPEPAREARANGSREHRASTISTGAHDQSAPPAKTRITTSELHNRLMTIERQMSAFISSGTKRSLERDEIGSRAQSTAISNHASPESAASGEGGGRQTFVGEISMQALAQSQAQIDDTATQHSDSSPVSTARPLTPRVRTRSNARRRSKSWLRETLFTYGIAPEEAECAKLLRIFFDEVYVLYPFLHAPSVWQTHAYLWKHSLLVSSDELEKGGESRLSVALVFVCLALGKCTGSSRMDNVDGSHSAGWSMYSVAMDLIRPYLDVTSGSMVSLDGLQVLGIMVVYLFRLDALDKAERVLAHAISGAHILGLHHKSFYARLSMFEDEMYTRVWWACYLLDRRLSLESGRPFLIQDANIEIRTPLDVSDTWLAQHRSSKAVMSDFADEIAAEKALAPKTVVPYVEAFISQSQIATDVWKAFYGTAEPGRNAGGMVHDYLDIALDNWWEKLPNFLKYDESRLYEDQCSELAWWQIKQCIHLHMRYIFLKLLVRRPCSHANETIDTRHNAIATEAYCAQLAASIIQIFDKIPDTFPRYSFVFMHPVTSATMILFTIVTRNSALAARYDHVLILAVRFLRSYCQKTWVSGKMIRTVSKLNHLVHGTFKKPASQRSPGVRGQADDQQQNLHNFEMERSLPADLSNPQHSSTAPLPYSRGQSYRDDMLSPVSNGFNGMPEHRFQPQNVSRHNLPPPSRHSDQTDIPITWPTASTNSAFIGMPNWAATDFDFEEAFNDFSGGQLYDFMNIDTFDLNDGWQPQQPVRHSDLSGGM